MVIARLSWLRWSYVFILLSAVEGWGIRKLVIFSLEARNNAPASSLHPSNDRTTFKESKFRLMTVNHDVIPQSSAALSRRLMKSLQSVLAIGLLVPAQALATRGAFEMDADFYFQNLFGVRKGKDPSFLKNGVIFPTPRRLDPVFASNIATIVFEELSRATNVQIEIFRNNVYGKVPYYLKYFCTFAPIVSESLDDQYYFDMIMYIAYLEAGRIVKQSEERVKLRQRIGDRILEYVSSSGEFVAPTATPNSTKAALAANLVNKRGNIKLLLNIFVAAKFISGYKYDDEPLDDIPYVLSSFNENLPVSFQVTLLSPITLLGFMQQVEANSFYHPEIIGTTINSYLRQMGLVSKFEDYLMDNYYREENFDIQAQDILLEFIVSATQNIS